MATAATANRLRSIHSFTRPVTDAGPADDALFSSRIESRLCMPADEFDKVEEKLGLREDAGRRTWTQTVYMDTDEFAMPLGYAVRTRSYLPERREIDLSNKEQFIDYGYMEYNRRIKLRSSGTMRQLLDELNRRFPLRASDFRPMAAVQYDRRVLLGHNVRVSVDSDVEGYEIGKGMELERMPLEGNLQIEIKHPGSDEGRRLEQMLRDKGAAYGISKHYMVFNKRRQLVGQKLKKEGLASATPDIEYEIKFNSEDETPFTRFILAAMAGEVDGFMPFRMAPTPRREESFNEYRKVPNADRKARVMYFGSLTPAIVEKDRGEMISGNILKRTELKNKMAPEQAAELLRQPLEGKTRRVKYHFCVESTLTDNIYITSIDLNQAEDGRQLYQIELEYYRSYNARDGKDREQEIVAELQQLAKFFAGAPGVIPTQLRKEDWARP